MRVRCSLDNGRVLLLRTERELLLAIAEGNLAENAHLDVKREAGTTDSSRTETARDLASFAIHGGSLLIGVAEEKDGRTMTSAPQPLEGMAEKIEQIAANRVDPPLFVRVQEIPTETDPALGYLLVEVPPSPRAPHMVDGRYYARGDRTKRRLTDGDVVAMHAAREPEHARVLRMLDDWSSRDVVASGREQQRGHLYVVGLPLATIRHGSFLDVSRAPNNTPAFDLATWAGRGVPAAFMNFSPSIRSAHNWVKRRDGSAFTSLKPGVPQLQADAREESLVDFELRDDGSFGVLMGRLTDVLTSRGETPVVFDFPAVGYAWQSVRVAQWISEHVGYRGGWGFGFRVDGMAGQLSFHLLNNGNIFQQVHPYSASDYMATTSASLTEIEIAPHAVVDRLVAGFLHGLGSHDAYRAALSTYPS